MKLETFLEKFDQFAATPFAVAKLRELVLQLAVKGKLVEQKPSEGDAGSLLEAFAVARNELGRPGEEERTEELAEVAGWHKVPASWRWVRLNTIGDIVGGGTPRSDNPAYFADEGIPWLTPADLNGFKAKRILRGRRCITQAGLENSSARLLPAGSVLFSSRAPIGYVAIAGTELATNQGFKSCVPFIPETNEFLYYFLMSAASRIDREASGTTFREVSGKIVSQIPVPLPPLAEQKRIVAKLDELMALCDLLEAQQQEKEMQQAALSQASLARFTDAPTPANLSFLFHESYNVIPADFRRAILNLAVQGRLVLQDPKDDSTAEMLAKIEVEKKRLGESGDLKADKKPWVGSSANPPHHIPDHWRWIRLQDVFEISRGGSPRPAGDPRFFGGTIPWVTVGEITKDTAKYLTETATGLTEEGSIRSRFINPGDLLLTNSGATLGVPKISKINGCINDGVAILRLFHPFELNEFAYLYLMHQTEAFRSVNQGMGQPNLNTPIIAGWFFPLPPLAEQRRIVAKVDLLMGLVDELEAQLTASRATAQDLLEALVAELTVASADRSGRSCR
jgi:type I restriction enzyme, S subunit